MNVWEVARPERESADVPDAPVPGSSDAAVSGSEAVSAPASAAGSEPAAERGSESGSEAVAPLDVEPPAATGEPEVDRAVARLTQAGVLPTDRHAEVYEDVHRELREVLAGLDR